MTPGGEGGNPRGSAQNVAINAVGDLGPRVELTERALGRVSRGHDRYSNMTETHLTFRFLFGW